MLSNIKHPEHGYSWLAVTVSGLTFSLLSAYDVSASKQVPRSRIDSIGTPLASLKSGHTLPLCCEWYRRLVTWKGLPAIAEIVDWDWTAPASGSESAVTTMVVIYGVGLLLRAATHSVGGPVVGGCVADDSAPAPSKPPRVRCYR